MATNREASCFLSRPEDEQHALIDENLVLTANHSPGAIATKRICFVEGCDLTVRAALGQQVCQGVTPEQAQGYQDITAQVAPLSCVRFARPADPTQP